MTDAFLNFIKPTFSGKLVLAGLLFSCAYYAPAFATPPGGGCPDFGGVNVNESYKLDAAQIEAAIKDGCDPPDNWLQRGGILPDIYSGGTKTLGKLEYVQPALGSADRPGLKYEDRGCNTYDPTKAGGKTDGGAIDACDLGAGAALASLPPIIAQIPAVGTPEVDCLTNLIGQIGGIFGGGGGGGSGQAITAEGNVSPTSGCASGSIGICGIGSISGSVCAGNPDGSVEATVTADENGPFAQVDNPKYIEVVTENFNYINDDINYNTTIYVPLGGVLAYDGTNYQIPENGYVTMNDEGVVFIGENAGPAEGIELLEVTGSNGVVSPDARVDITAVDGVLLVDEAIFQGNTITGNGTVQTVTTAQSSTPTQRGRAGLDSRDYGGPTATAPEAPWLNSENYAGSFPPIPDPNARPSPNANPQGPAAARPD